MVYSAQYAKSSEQSIPIKPSSVNTITYRALDYVVIILMENRDYGDILGNLTAAPYINHLANRFGAASAYYDVSSNRSLPNYLGLTTGQTYSSWSGCNKPPQQCSGFTPITIPTIVDSVEKSGLTWKAYMEDMPSNCYQSDYGLYVVRHNPFAYFGHVVNDSSECNLVIPAGTNASTMISDLASNATASNLMWLTPDLCDDMHNCTVYTGDTYLSHIVPEILNSYIFQTQSAALFITWDEGSNSAHIPAIWAGPSAKNNYTSIVAYNHYSFLKTLEVAWHLPALTSNDAKASAMMDFFNGPRSSFTYAPLNPQAGQTVTFVSTVEGGFQPYSYSWSFGDGTQGSGTTVNHNYSDPGSYNVAFSSRDSFNQTSYTGQAISVSLDEAKPNSSKTPIVKDRGPTANVETTFLIWLGNSIPLSVMMGSAFATVLIGTFSARRKKH